MSAWGGVVWQSEDGAALYPCPVCAVPYPEPCEDAFLCAAVALCERGSHTIARHANGQPVAGHDLALTLLTDAAWPAVLEAARAHGGGCPDPMECDDCCTSRSVLQVDAWYWHTASAALA